MCRHLIPHIDLHVGQALHGLGRLIVEHPNSVAAAILIPAFGALSATVYGHLRRCGVFGGSAFREGSARPRLALVGDALEPARSG